MATKKTPTPAKPSVVKDTIEYVVANDVETADGKVHRVLYKLPDVQHKLFFSVNPRTKRLKVGHVYGIPTETENEKTSIVVTDAKWVREYEVHVDVVKWQAAQVAIEETTKAKAVEKRLATDVSGLRAAILPLRRAYYALPSAQHAAFEVWLLKELRKF